MSFKFERTKIPDVIHIQPDVFRDKRGFFAEIYKKKDFESFGIKEEFVQGNHSQSRKGVLRGMHYQLDPVAQGKLITVFKGEIYDAVVDIRKGSPYFGKWVGAKLDAQTKNMLYVPPGFAHGFCVLSDEAEVVYNCTQIYALQSERGILWSDPALAIDWPVKKPLVSDKDGKYPLLKDAEINYIYRK